MEMTTRQNDALEEFRGKVPGYVCPWKPKTMASLAEIGLVSPVERFGEISGYMITDAGRTMLTKGA